MIRESNKRTMWEQKIDRNRSFSVIKVMFLWKINTIEDSIIRRSNCKFENKFKMRIGKPRPFPI